MFWFGISPRQVLKVQRCRATHERLPEMLRLCHPSERAWQRPGGCKANLETTWISKFWRLKQHGKQHESPNACVYCWFEMVWEPTVLYPACFQASQIGTSSAMQVLPVNAKRKDGKNDVFYNPAQAQ